MLSANKSLFALRQRMLDRIEGGELAVQYHKLQRVDMFMSLCLSLVQRSKCTAYSEFLLLFLFDGCSRSQVLQMGWKLKPECFVVWFWIHVINLASITILNVTAFQSWMNSAVGEHDGCSWPFWWFARPCYVCFFRYVLQLSQPLTWCSMKQSIWENGCWRWCIIRIYLPLIIYDLWVAQFALETSSFLMMYWVFIKFFSVIYCTCTSQKNGRYNWNLLFDPMFQATCR